VYELKDQNLQRSLQLLLPSSDCRLVAVYIDPDWLFFAPLPQLDLSRSDPLERMYHGATVLVAEDSARLSDPVAFDYSEQWPLHIALRAEKLLKRPPGSASAQHLYLMDRVSPEASVHRVTPVRLWSTAQQTVIDGEVADVGADTSVSSGPREISAVPEHRSGELVDRHFGLVSRIREAGDVGICPVIVLEADVRLTGEFASHLSWHRVRGTGPSYVSAHRSVLTRSVASYAAAQFEATAGSGSEKARVLPAGNTATAASTSWDDALVDALLQYARISTIYRASSSRLKLPTVRVTDLPLDTTSSFYLKYLNSYSFLIGVVDCSSIEGVPMIACLGADGSWTMGVGASVVAAVRDAFERMLSARYAQSDDARRALGVYASSSWQIRTRRTRNWSPIRYMMNSGRLLSTLTSSSAGRRLYITRMELDPHANTYSKIVQVGSAEFPGALRSETNWTEQK
jgi:hypothetical protein